MSDQSEQLSQQPLTSTPVNPDEAVIQREFRDMWDAWQAVSKLADPAKKWLLAHL
jgi:hypothetical protein